MMVGVCLLSSCMVVNCDVFVRIRMVKFSICGRFSLVLDVMMLNSILKGISISRNGSDWIMLWCRYVVGLCVRMWVCVLVCVLVRMLDCMGVG